MLAQLNAARLPFADNSINVFFLSPPYYGLRLYDGLEPQVWGGDGECDHAWESETYNRGNDGPRDYGSYDGAVGRGPAVKHTAGAFCQHCPAWLGHLGNEPDFRMFIEHLVMIGQEIKRCLHPSGIWFLNLGDSFATNPGNGRGGGERVGGGIPHYSSSDKTKAGLPAKNKMLLPHRIAIALQDAGWIVRQDLPWIKRNGLPESVSDRPSTAHEYVFMLTKSQRYHFDGEAVKRGLAEASVGRLNQDGFWDQAGGEKDYNNGTNQNRSARKTLENLAVSGSGSRQYRTSDPWLDSLDALIAEARAYLDHLEAIKSDGGLLLDESADPLALWLASEPYALAHYAVFPSSLVRDLVRGAAGEAGVCAACGEPWERVVERTGGTWDERKNSGEPTRHGLQFTKKSEFKDSQSQTTGWQPACDCNAPTVPAIVCDPFCGSGTVGEVCGELGLRFVGGDLSGEYLIKHAAVRAEGRTTPAALEEEKKRLKKKYRREPVKSKKVKKIEEAGQLGLFD